MQPSPFLYNKRKLFYKEILQIICFQGLIETCSMYQHITIIPDLHQYMNFHVISHTI